MANQREGIFWGDTASDPKEGIGSSFMLAESRYGLLRLSLSQVLRLTRLHTLTLIMNLDSQEELCGMVRLQPRWLTH